MFPSMVIVRESTASSSAERDLLRHYSADLTSTTQLHHVHTLWDGCRMGSSMDLLALHAKSTHTRTATTLQKTHKVSAITAILPLPSQWKDRRMCFTLHDACRMLTSSIITRGTLITLEFTNIQHSTMGIAHQQISR